MWHGFSTRAEGQTITQLTNYDSQYGLKTRVTKMAIAQDTITKKFRLHISAEVGRSFAAFIRQHIRIVQEQLKSPLTELSIGIVGDRRMSELHERFLHISGPTDVLTFELDHNARGKVISGEVIICLPQAKRQAQLRKIPLQDELLLYVLHGMLHLCGFDDKTESGYRHMHRTEDRILSQLGIGPVFSGSSPNRSRNSKDR